MKFFPGVHTAASKSVALNESANVSTAAVKKFALNATDVHTGSIRDIASTATITRAKLTAASTKAIGFVRNTH